MADVYEIITERILKQLENGAIPWQQPWIGGNERPTNAVTGHRYRGINPLLLNSFAAEGGFKANRWLSKNQLRLKKTCLKKGEEENSALVIFWRIFDGKNEPDQNPVHEQNIRQIKRKKFMLRYYRVYNIEQVENPELFATDEKNAKETATIEKTSAIDIPAINNCEQIIQQWQDKPKIRHADHRACYIPSLDLVNLPPIESFHCTEHYYSTLFHEMIHATGHHKRLNRFGNSPNTDFGDEEYSKEELCAEIGAAFLCGECKISGKTIENSGAYIESWIKTLRGDSRLVVFGAAQAAKAADYILGKKPAEY